MKAQEKFNQFFRFFQLEYAKECLLTLKDAKHIFTENWGIYEICMHCAQTISYSMTGYPKMKPAIVRLTIGKAVVSKYLKQGYMKHNLQSHVSGGEKIDPNGEPAAGIDHLLSEIEKLENYTGTLKPHSVFGEMTREDYMKYFAMHISDHFSEVTFER